MRLTSSCARQSEGSNRTRWALRKVCLFGLVWCKKLIAGPYVDPASRYGRPTPDGAEIDLLLEETLAGRGIESDELVAHCRREIHHAVGHSEPRGDGVADVGESGLVRRSADGLDLVPFVSPVLLRVSRLIETTRPPVGGK